MDDPRHHIRAECLRTPTCGRDDFSKILEVKFFSRLYYVQYVLTHREHSENFCN